MPEGIEEGKKICKLKKALYGLKQAPVIWNNRFTQVLKIMNFENLKSDHCVFKNKKGTIFLVIYVDDGLAIGKDLDELLEVVKVLEREFELTSQTNPDNFLGMEIQRSPNGIKLTQENYIKSVLRRFRMMNANPMSIPAVDVSEKSSKVVKYPYREAIGSLLHLSTKTRPDIAFAVNLASRSMDSFVQEDVNSVKRILKYLVGTASMGIRFSAKAEFKKLEAYCDADFAGDKNTRKSTTGYIIMTGEGGGPLSWCSRKQPIITLSTTEAEYVAAADCVKELTYLKSMIKEMCNSEVNVMVNVDNQSAISLIKIGVVNKRSKHIDVRYHYIHENHLKGEFDIEYCPSANQIADIFTKPLKPLLFGKHRNSIIFSKLEN